MNTFRIKNISKKLRLFFYCCLLNFYSTYNKFRMCFKLSFPPIYSSDYFNVYSSQISPKPIPQVFFTLGSPHVFLLFSKQLTSPAELMIQNLLKLSCYFGCYALFRYSAPFKFTAVLEFPQLQKLNKSIFAHNSKFITS